MCQQATTVSKSTNRKSNRYDDWTCHICQNYNYSFRKICNRCNLQTKQSNLQLTQLYQQRMKSLQKQQQIYYSLHAIDSFPNVLLLVINDDPWQEYPQKRQSSEVLNTKWINNLIEE